MNLTARGYVAVATVGLAVLLGWAFGQPALNAVAAPLTAALVVAALLVRQADPPAVQYEAVRSGQSGENRTIRFEVRGSGLAAVRRPLPEGLGGREIGAVVTLPHEFEQTVTLDERGLYDLDAPTVVQRDPFGFVERPVEVGGHTSLVVYPETYALADPTLDGLFANTAPGEREAFSRLREYTPGDPLRDVHWKSSAKHGEFFVVEYDPSDRHGEVTIAAGARQGHADEMAAAVATVALSALDSGLAVDLWLPDDHFHYNRGTDRETLLRMLAEVDAGPLPDQAREEADLLLVSGVRGTSLGLPDGNRRFDSLIAPRRESSREVPA